MYSRAESSRRLFPLEREIAETVEKAWNAIPSGTRRGGWTSAVKKALVQLGKKHRWGVYTSGGKSIHPRGREWLWDLTWVDEEEAFKGYRKFGGLKLLTVGEIA